MEAPSVLSPYSAPYCSYFVRPLFFCNKKNIPVVDKYDTWLWTCMVQIDVPGILIPHYFHTVRIRIQLSILMRILIWILPFMFVNLPFYLFDRYFIYIVVRKIINICLH
jgi:hypothetical protein